MSRLLCCVLCLLVSPAAAQRPLVITDDTVIDYEVTEERIEVQSGRLTVVDGGKLNDIRVFDGASISVLGGDIYNVTTGEGSIDNLISGGHLESGGYLRNTVISGGSLEYAMLLSTTRMEGGEIQRSDARSATISGGIIHYVQVNDGLPLFVNGGVVGEVEGSFVINDGSIDFGNGAFGFMGDDADFSINGGHVNRIATSGVVLIQGGALETVQAMEVIVNDGSQLPGDGDRDGFVGLEDLNGVRNEFGGYPQYSPFDMNYDLSVNLTDLNLVRNNFGKSLQQSVPEPSSILLATSLVPMFLYMTRRASRSRRPQPA